MDSTSGDIEIWKDYFDIVILPPPAVRDYAIALSKQLAEHGAKFVLGKRRYLPHISLYHIPVPPEHFNNFCGRVKSIVEDCDGGELTSTEMKIPLLLIDKPAWLETLHMRVINESSAFFDWQYGVEDFW